MRARMSVPAAARESGRKIAPALAVPVAIKEVLTSAGAPLDADVRQEMEDRFQHDFSSVRVHTDAAAIRSADSVNALAYTVADDMVFGAGQYTPHRQSGRQLLAHELAHVVQQTRNHSHEELSSADAAELSADRAAADVVNSHAPVRVAGRAAPGLARARAPRPPAPPPIRGEFRTTETQFVENGVSKVRIVVEGYVGDPIKRPGLELKYPGPGESGLPGYHRWHLAGPGAIGGESGIFYAPGRFNLSETKEVENAIRKAHAEARQKGEISFRFEAVARIEGDVQGVQRRILESVTWEADLRMFGTDSTTRIVSRTETVQGPGVTRPPPLQPRSSAPATYTATKSTLKRSDVPDPEVWYQRPRQGGDTASPASGAADPLAPAQSPPTTQPPQAANAQPAAKSPETKPATPAGVPPQTKPATSVGKPPGAKPAAPAGKPLESTPAAPENKPPQSKPTVPPAGTPPTTPSDIVNKELEKAGARGGGLLLGASLVADAFNKMGSDMQRGAARSAFFAQQSEIEKTLDANPGFGVMLEFVFFRLQQDPDSLLKPADQFQELIIYPARSPADIPAGIYAGQKAAMLIIRRSWIKPKAIAAGGAASTPGASDSRTSIVLRDAAAVEGALSFIRSQAHVTHGRVFSAFKSATPTFSSPARVDVGGVLLEMPAAVYYQLLPQLEQAAIDSFTRSFNSLDAALREVTERYDRLSKEGFVKRWWNDRSFELPTPTMLDDAKGSLALARDWLTKKNFDLARSNLETARYRSQKVQDMLDKYENIQRPWHEDEP